MAPIPIALVGSGIFAQSSHLPAILKSPDNVTLKAVYSRTLASCAKLCEGLESKIDWYSEETVEGGGKRDYQDLLADGSIEGVVICSTFNPMFLDWLVKIFLASSQTKVAYASSLCTDVLFSASLPIPHQEPFIRAALAADKHVLSEKPISPTVSAASNLLSWYHESLATNGEVSTTGAGTATWSVGENWRMLDSHSFAASEIKGLGRLLGFRVRVGNMVMPGGKYYETEWRKNPSYQGGFLLDGGIHYIAATRFLLGPAHEFARISAFTSQVQEHLHPVDTVNASILTKSNVSGTFSVSFGTTFRGQVYEVACEHGTVTVEPSKVTVKRNSHEEGVEFPKPRGFPDEGNGVLQEIRAWSEGIATGTQDSRLLPEEALKDLKTLEAMLRSGEQKGAPVDMS